MAATFSWPHCVKYFCEQIIFYIRNPAIDSDLIISMLTVQCINLKHMHYRDTVI